jgi:hypothetical protein
MLNEHQGRQDLGGGPGHGEKDVQWYAQSIRHMHMRVADRVCNDGIRLHTTSHTVKQENGGSNETPQGICTARWEHTMKG